MPLKWRKQWIADEPFESAGVFDVDGDGVLDIVCGAFWYQGPDFRRKHPVGEVKRYGEYHDDFSTIPLDINGDGRLDFITGGWWGNTLRWRENPGEIGKVWPEHIIAEVGNVETTRGWDIDGCGTIEIVPNTPGNRLVQIFKLKKGKDGKAAAAFDKHVVFEFPSGQAQGHGNGCGDIAGNGRMDLVFTHGWLECPARPWEEPWQWHPEFTLGRGSNPILVVDLNGDGVSELINGQAHGYG
ncbi:MAG: VCBS repeat-containing protein, partial [Planctomycetota bacterium]|nr:VCBS repeat-containing protein [Planctomycetota bacterium]